MNCDNIDCDTINSDYITCIDLTASGKLTATNDASSIVSNSNAVYTVGITTGSYYIPLISNTGGTGYRSLYNISSINNHYAPFFYIHSSRLFLA
jgi:hypothetical protein